MIEKLFYDAWYRFGSPPWAGTARSELVHLVESGRLAPGRAIDLGCGEGDNAIFLAQHGFTVTAIDYAPSAIAKAKRKAAADGASVEFLVDNLTRLRHVTGQFDLLVDYGTLDDLGFKQRDRYMQQVLPLARTGSHFLLWCFEWELALWERVFTSVLPFGKLALAPGEAEQRFGNHYLIERIAGEANETGWPKGYAAYLMSRK